MQVAVLDLHHNVKVVGRGGGEVTGSEAHIIAARGGASGGGVGVVVNGDGDQPARAVVGVARDGPDSTVPGQGGPVAGDGYHALGSRVDGQGALIRGDLVVAGPEALTLGVGDGVCHGARIGDGAGGGDAGDFTGHEAIAGDGHSGSGQLGAVIGSGRCLRGQGHRSRGDLVALFRAAAVVALAGDGYGDDVGHVGKVLGAVGHIVIRALCQGLFAILNNRHKLVRIAIVHMVLGIVDGHAARIIGIGNNALRRNGQIAINYFNLDVAVVCGRCGKVLCFQAHGVCALIGTCSYCLCLLGASQGNAAVISCHFVASDTLRIASVGLGIGPACHPNHILDLNRIDLQVARDCSSNNILFSSILFTHRALREGDRIVPGIDAGAGGSNALEGHASGSTGEALYSLLRAIVDPGIGIGSQSHILIVAEDDLIGAGSDGNRLGIRNRFLERVAVNHFLSAGYSRSKVRFAGYANCDFLVRPHILYRIGVAVHSKAARDLHIPGGHGKGSVGYFLTINRGGPAGEGVAERGGRRGHGHACTKLVLSLGGHLSRSLGNGSSVRISNLVAIPGVVQPNHQAAVSKNRLVLRGRQACVVREAGKVSLAEHCGLAGGTDPIVCGYQSVPIVIQILLVVLYGIPGVGARGPGASEGHIFGGHSELAIRHGDIAGGPTGEGVAGRGGRIGHGHNFINLVGFRFRQVGCARRGSTIIIAHGEIALDIVDLNYVAVLVSRDGKRKILSFIKLIARNALVLVVFDHRTNIHRAACLRSACTLHTVIVILNGVVLLRGNVLAIVAGIGGNDSVKFRLLGAGFIGIPAVKLIGKIAIHLGLVHVRPPQTGLEGAAVYTPGSALNCGKGFKSRVLYQEVYAADIFLVQDDCVVVVIGILADNGIIPVISRIRAIGDRHIHGRQGVVALFIGIFRTRRGILVGNLIIFQTRIQCLFRI